MIKHLATVITNLLSAIPWIGQDFVEFEKLLLFIITRANKKRSAPIFISAFFIILLLNATTI
jgi:hypothetical protein